MGLCLWRVQDLGMGGGRLGGLLSSPGGSLSPPRPAGLTCPLAAARPLPTPKEQRRRHARAMQSQRRVLPLGSMCATIERNLRELHYSAGEAQYAAMPWAKPPAGRKSSPSPSLPGTEPTGHPGSRPGTSFGAWVLWGGREGKGMARPIVGGCGAAAVRMQAVPVHAGFARRCSTPSDEHTVWLVCRSRPLPGPHIPRRLPLLSTCQAGPAAATTRRPPAWMAWSRPRRWQPPRRCPPTGPRPLCATTPWTRQLRSRRAAWRLRR